MRWRSLTLIINPRKIMLQNLEEEPEAIGDLLGSMEK